jgi:hypothetical protein
MRPSIKVVSLKKALAIAVARRRATTRSPMAV